MIRLAPPWKLDDTLSKGVFGPIDERKKEVNQDKLNEKLEQGLEYSSSLPEEIELNFNTEDVEVVEAVD